MIEANGICEVLANVRQWHVQTADVLAGLRMIPDESVQCCVTSPPYWGLRDYGTEGQIGLESSPNAFVERLVQVFREVRRALRSDGTLWLNIGDSYTGSGKGGNPEEGKQATNKGSQTVGVLYGKAGETARQAAVANVSRRFCVENGLPPKNLAGVPWRLALALQADGWYLRQDVIWAKPNSMPESVTDRCTKSHEYIFLLTKSERYFYDRMAIAEPLAAVSIARAARGVSEENKHLDGAPGQIPHSLHAPRKAVKFGGTKHADEAQTRLASGNEWNAEDSANKRSVWTIPVGSYRQAHFATFPIALPLTCLKAGTPAKGQCPECGSPWERVIESEKLTRERPNELTKRNGTAGTGNHCANTVAGVSSKTTGWRPTCKCNSKFAPVPSVALDCFSGAGTTGVAAKSLGLRYIGLELNPDYAEMSRRRIDKGLAEGAPKQPKSLAGQKELFGATA